ncbi:MAG: hypothetical protein JWM33_1211, partial [Caulobacteraceae bacterium]|nr:hypothetical protein [Caulobacteraceae bacterium]
MHAAIGRRILLAGVTLVIGGSVLAVSQSFGAGAPGPAAVGAGPTTPPLGGGGGQPAQPGLPANAVDNSAGKPRLFVLSDMGNEPDDQMSMVRLLLYSNEIDIEGFGATTSTWQRAITRTDTMLELIKAYGQVRSNLLLHAQGWPTAESLAAVTKSGQPAYGMASTGVGQTSAAASQLIAAADKSDPRPLWVTAWGGTNTLAQALIEVRTTRTPEQLAAFIAKLRVYAISDQDDAGVWIRHEFPALYWVGQASATGNGDYLYATWTGISGDHYYNNGPGADFSKVTNEWLDENVRAKGPLGAHYPRYAFIMEGDTPSYLNLIGNGLNGWRNPNWGGWGGRYIYRQPSGESHAFWTQGNGTGGSSLDTVRGVDGALYRSDQASIWRWRDAYQNDFAARMDWTIKPFAQANHAPSVVVNSQTGNGPVTLDATTGQALTLNLAGTRDPDAGQTLKYRLWRYEEAGLASGPSAAALTLASETTDHPTITATACNGG